IGCPALPTRFSAAPDAYAPTTQALASAWQSSKASPKHTTERSPSPPAPQGGSASRCNYPPRHRTLADDDQGNCRIQRRNVVGQPDAVGRAVEQVAGCWHRASLHRPPPPPPPP